MKIIRKFKQLNKKNKLLFYISISVIILLSIIYFSINSYNNSNSKSKIKASYQVEESAKPTKPEMNLESTEITPSIDNIGMEKYKIKLKITKGFNYTIVQKNETIEDNYTEKSNGKWQTQELSFGTFEKEGEFDPENHETDYKIIIWDSDDKSTQYEKAITLLQLTPQQKQEQINKSNAYLKQLAEAPTPPSTTNSSTFDKQTAKNTVEEMHDRIDGQDGISEHVNNAVSSYDKKAMKKELTVIDNVKKEVSDNKVNASDYSSDDELYIGYYNDFWDDTISLLDIQENYLNNMLDTSSKTKNFSSDLKDALSTWNADYNELTN